ncbi:hypothetical protein GPECTOR_34g812 [Gonium pectorale]|uniref:Uncharacterized protein n=1 Tax=Gonium pectorale TaxID=33097 RepID=A0A150GCZ7_GONPE|nr:hypothetical protein GPECTOR_34g812 [Gonium pectorale]|eukprot:KXZ47653.1 hypothetical protein GPECTOR_34g812 [Gonium pectorale]
MGACGLRAVVTDLGLVLDALHNSSGGGGGGGGRDGCGGGESCGGDTGAGGCCSGPSGASGGGLAPAVLERLAWRAECLLRFCLARRLPGTAAEVRRFLTDVVGRPADAAAVTAPAAAAPPAHPALRGSNPHCGARGPEPQPEPQPELHGRRRRHRCRRQRLLGQAGRTGRRTRGAAQREGPSPVPGRAGGRTLPAALAALSLAPEVQGGWRQHGARGADGLQSSGRSSECGTAGWDARGSGCASSTALSSSSDGEGDAARPSADPWVSYLDSCIPAPEFGC